MRAANLDPSRRGLFVRLLLPALLLPFALVLLMAAKNPDDPREAARELIQQGNYAEAYDKLAGLLESQTVDPKALRIPITQAVQCLNRLNRTPEVDPLLEGLAERFAASPDVLNQIASEYQDLEHYGYQVAGEFQRGDHRGGGLFVNSAERDRVRCLQLLMQAAGLGAGEGADHRLLAETLIGSRMGRAAWRLQAKTDLTTLPDYEQGWWNEGGANGAPVDADGNPVFYAIPASFEAATNDGERWRWALERWSQQGASESAMATDTRIDFLRSQFGVETLQQWGAWFGRSEPDSAETKAGVFALHTLAEDETIAKLASGVKRFKLPDEQNPIRLLQARLRENIPRSAGAATQLAEIFENRRQFDRAAEYWSQAIKLLPADQKEPPRNRLEQIQKPWGRFEGTPTQAAGEGAELSFRFRNAGKVKLIAQRIQLDALLADTRAYLESSPRQLDWQRLNIASLGYRLVEQNQAKYVGEQVAQWMVELPRAEGHFDSRIELKSPLQTGGAYLVTATVEGGNTSKIVVWVADTVIVRKNSDGKLLYFVADALTGAPIAGAQVEFFGYRLVSEPRPNRYHVETLLRAEKSDADGLIDFEAAQNDGRGDHQWMVTARTPQGGLALLGFDSYWRPSLTRQRFQNTTSIVLTDRPVYRPGQKVQGKAWVARAAYDLPAGPGEFAHQQFSVELYDPQQTKVITRSITSNAYGGFEFDYVLPADAALGEYRWAIVGHGQGTFRVEEYKKPEYEVTIDSPNDPVRLGEAFEATVRANYYFGSPVTSAVVKYKVLRTSRDEGWFPPAPWDWLYGPGYWWFGSDYDWYPGFASWGCRAPFPWWGWRAPQQPELVAEGQAPIGPDGTLKVRIETALARELHGGADHEYRIEAQVVDASRRTIVGTGSVVVSRKPFTPHVWLDKGFYRVGDTATASVMLRRPDGKTVESPGRLRLLRVRYPQGRGKPEETEVRAWDLATDSSGAAQLKFQASQPGQYRLAYEATPPGGEVVEGGLVFTIVGDGTDGREFQFNDLELVLNQKTYAPGETAFVQVNTARADSTVLLFVRPENGVCPPPQIVRLAGKSAIIPIEVALADMPNFYVEALTVSSAKVHSVVKSVVVPPAERVLRVEALPSAREYKPGETARVKLRVTDSEGQPVRGDLAIAVSDKSVEYISGGSNVPEIRQHFWKWRREHQANTSSSTDRAEGNLVPKDAKPMEDIGAFGGVVVDESTDRFLSRADGATSRRALSSLGVPMSAAPAEASKLALSDSLSENEAGATDAGPAPAASTPTVRTNFADTAFWSGSIETDAKGLAEVEFTMPESLTAWRFRTWCMGPGTRVGESSTEAVTRKNLMVRLQTSRFLVDTDSATFSTNVHNYLPTPQRVRVRLETEGGLISVVGSPETTIEVPPGEDRRVDWTVTAAGEGIAKVRTLAIAESDSDAMQLEVPVLVHGMAKLESVSGVITAANKSGGFEFNVPERRRPQATRLEVRFSPTLAGAMLDALPYLIDYPHGCTEQTLNRFLPAVVTQQTLARMGIDLDSVRGGTNLNPQELGDPAQREEGWKRYDRSPVFDPKELEKIVKSGVGRLSDMQLADGGWGWFSGWGEQSTPHTTAVVLRGLLVARENGVAIPEGVIERGVQWLDQWRSEQIAWLQNIDAQGKQIDLKKPTKTQADNLDSLTQCVLTQAGKPSEVMRDFLQRDRTKLTPYGVALFGLSLHYEGTTGDDAPAKQRAQMLQDALRNLRQFVVEDDENQTAYLNLGGGSWWYWYGGEIETHAAFLKLLAAAEPKGALAPKLVKYLLNNRKHASYWDSTRDTALVVEAMADYLEATGEARPDTTIEVWIDGKKEREVRVTAENLFSFDNTVTLDGEAVAAGMHTIELRRTGEGPLYYNGYLSVFTLEDRIPAAGLEVRIARRYFKLTRKEATETVAGSRGQAIEQRIEKYDRTEITEPTSLSSGDLVEVELKLESKNDYEYLMLFDPKGAGFEPVEVRSGYGGNELGAYVEYRDQSVNLFVRQLARGAHSVTYRLRAETPGHFSALPARIEAMYAPELRGNSDEFKHEVLEGSAE